MKDGEQLGTGTVQNMKEEAAIVTTSCHCLMIIYISAPMNRN